jgi:hypothetical protein
MRLGAPIGALALVALIAIGAVPAAPPPVAIAGERVSIRLSPQRQAVRVYLAPSAVATKIRSRLDRRLHFVGVLQRGRRVLGFTVPPLDSGRYDVWCVRCARGVQLRIRTPKSSCPLTLPLVSRVFGNGLISVGPPMEADGTVEVGPDNVDPERGLFWTKLGWRVKPESVGPGELSVVLRRLDAAAPLRVVETVRGADPNWWSWRARMWFPSEGCFRVTGRVEDVALSFGVRVVLAKS